MSLVFAPITNWPTLLLLAGGVLAEILWTYRAKRHRAGRGLLPLRLATWFIALFVMLRPSLEMTETDAGDAVLLIAADASPSMQTRDTPGAQSRRQAILNVMKHVEDQLDELGEKIEIRRFDFADGPETVEEFTDRSMGDQTSLVYTLDELLNEFGNRRGVGLLLLSDGAQRAYAPHDGDPRTAAMRFGERRIPIRAVPLGGTGFSESALDLAVEEIFVDPIAFENTTVPVTVRLRAIGAEGRTIRARLLLENRTAVSNGTSGPMLPPTITADEQPAREIRIQSANQVIPLDLTFVPRQSGEFKIRVEVEELEREVKTVNNSRETIITIRKGGIRVALFHPLPTEQRFLRKINQSEQIQLDFQLVQWGEQNNTAEIRPDWFEPKRYDAYIIGDVPAAAFTPAELNALAQRVVQDGAGLMMLGGFRSYGPGGYATTPLTDVLPVLMEPSEFSADGSIDPDLHILRDLPMRPTERGRTHYLMQLGSSDSSDAMWEKMPPLKYGSRLREKPPLTERLAESPDGTPLLLATEVGRARVLAFAGDSTWRWAMHGFQEQHLRFWQQVILWLSRKELDTDQALWVRVQPRNFGPGQRVPLELGARDDKGAPLDGVDFNVNITSPDGETATPTPQRSPISAEDGGGDSYGVEFVGTNAAGDYWVKVTGSKDGRPVGPPAWTRFLVNAGDIELDNPAADPALMAELASLSGGSVVQPEALESFLDELLARGVDNLDVHEIRRISLWDNQWVMLAFIGLLSIEWFLRKRRGMA